MTKYILKAEAAIRQPISEEDNTMWESASDETRNLFIADMQRDMELTLKSMVGETGEVVVRVWMDISND